MSYDEHLISMAGGDGDALDGIQRRILDCQTYKFGMFNADKLAHEDAPYLLALVREQAAKLARVDDLSLALRMESRAESEAHPESAATKGDAALRIRAELKEAR